MCDTLCLLLDSKTLATGLLAEFGFLGVVILTLITVPFICGCQPNIGFFFLSNFLEILFCCIVDKNF